ncbi:MAG TPA: bifunctional DNA-formamidopyrimidine glycosylase/DNA-(apurinic or apyrimidinic site) lyase [Candidatus Paceibacterota bacterium]|nr:bifunctional DNA-formamidopyrimidine glycosylase/DNA-(apurinic or apyrimidinic site) lyase [Candidatus Paceibacterota bacterium]
MPELPEVQTTVNGLNKNVIGLSIKDVWTDYRSVSHVGKDNIKDKIFFANFRRKILGKKILGASRRAKNVLIHLSGDLTVLIHMKMTGHIMYGQYVFNKNLKKDPWQAAEKDGPLADPYNRHLHLVFSLSSKKQLVLSDMRKFAKVTLIESKNPEESPHLANLGPEPLPKEFTYAVFKKQIMRRPNGRIKNVLMDQELIAGIGNIYSDEALFRAHIHPESHPAKIPEKNLKLLYPAIKGVLKKGLDFGGDSTSDYRNIKGERGKFQAEHHVYRRAGKPCPKKGCKGKIVRKVVGGRSAHFCPVHQKLFK